MPVWLKATWFAMSCPNISALNFVMTGALGGGVTRSLSLDAHGKSLSSALLDLDIDAALEDK